MLDHSKIGRQCHIEIYDYNLHHDLHLVVTICSQSNFVNLAQCKFVKEFLWPLIRCKGVFDIE